MLLAYVAAGDLYWGIDAVGTDAPEVIVAAGAVECSPAARMAGASSKIVGNRALCNRVRRLDFRVRRRKRRKRNETGEEPAVALEDFM